MSKITYFRGDEVFDNFIANSKLTLAGKSVHTCLFGGGYNLNLNASDQSVTGLSK
jgi:hypothetical protein